MRKKAKRKRLSFRAWLAIATIIIIFAAVCFLAGRDSKGPSYAGRSADDWLSELVHPRSASDFEQNMKSATSAFQHMGTNGISFLVESMQRRDSPFSKLYARLLRIPPKGVASLLPKVRRATSKASIAPSTLTAIDDPQPEVTFARLVNILSSSNLNARLFAADAIRSYVEKYPKIDVASYRPRIVLGLTYTNMEEPRIVANIPLVQALDKAGLGGPEVVAALQPLLTNSDPVMRAWGQQVLNELNPTNVSAITNAP